MIHPAPSSAELLEVFSLRRAELIQKALEARRQARSYRDFRVGCALLAFDSQALERSHAYRIFTGANWKPTPRSKKVCAEANAVRQMKEAGFDRIVGLVVLGEPQPDTHSGRASKTLHPCGDCRALLTGLAEHPEEVPILTVQASQPDISEQLALAELHAIHQTRNP